MSDTLVKAARSRRARFAILLFALGLSYVVMAFGGPGLGLPLPFGG